MRCYTVLLACGWLLFTPPVKAVPELKSYGFLTGAPLSEWKQERAFDNAKDCEEWKGTSIKNSIPNPSAPGLFAIWEYARCIPSDTVQFRMK